VPAQKQRTAVIVVGPGIVEKALDSDPRCSSIVSGSGGAGEWKMSATRRAEIGSRGLAFRSWAERRG